MKIKINKKLIKYEFRKLNISYQDLYEITGKDINYWKHVLNKGGYMKEEELKELAEILQCDMSLLFDQEYQVKLNTPIELDLLVRKLYERRKGDIQPVYESIMKDFQKTGKLENFIGEANRLLAILFSSDDLAIDLVPTLSIIINDFQRDRIFSGSYAELGEDTISDVFKVIIDSVSRNYAQQAMALFLYSLILFDVVFLQECIASVTQFSTERFGDKADQYCLLTLKIEILRYTLLNCLINGELKMLDFSVEEITDEIMTGVHLMLLACCKADQHINCDYFSSEYVNRSELDGIITRLTRIITNLGIQVPEPLLGLSGTRFYRHLCHLRIMLLANKKYKTKMLQQNDFLIGYYIGMNSK